MEGRSWMYIICTHIFTLQCRYAVLHSLLVHYTELAWYYSDNDFHMGLRLKALSIRGDQILKDFNYIFFALCREIPRGTQPHSYLQII